MNFSTVIPMLNSVDRLLNLLNLSLSTEFTEFENNNLAVHHRKLGLGFNTTPCTVLSSIQYSHT